MPLALMVVTGRAGVLFLVKELTRVDGGSIRLPMMRRDAFRWFWFYYGRCLPSRPSGCYF